MYILVKNKNRKFNQNGNLRTYCYGPSILGRLFKLFFRNIKGVAKIIGIIKMMKTILQTTTI